MTRTPEPILAKLNRETVRILDLQDVKERLLALGAEPSPTTPAQFDDLIKAEVAKFKKIVQEANIRVE